MTTEMTLMFWKICAWLAMLLVVVASLGPITTRPVSGLPVPLERFGAFAVVSGLFALAYPGHLVRVGIFLILAVILLEALQMLSPGRHPRLLDAMEKIIGVVAGITLSSISSLKS